MSIETPTLETDRLIMRPPSADAFPHYEEFYTDAEASRFYEGPLTVGQAWETLAADIGFWQLQGFGVWILEQRSDGRLLGGCGFWQGRGWPRELTWWLLPEARRNGYASEASRAAIAHAYNVFGWDHVETYMDDDNEPAHALVLRLGGIENRRETFIDGEDRTIYRIPRSP
jgi:RimJ/RimL family protein N-acetyltransferase